MDSGLKRLGIGLVLSSLMASQHRIVSLLLAVLALTSLVYAIRVDDTPFSQLQVKRWLFAGAEKIADWEPLEFPGDILQVC